jgi:hypothetical protein
MAILWTGERTTVFKDATWKKKKKKKKNKGMKVVKGKVAMAGTQSTVWDEE